MQLRMLVIVFATLIVLLSPIISFSQAKKDDKPLTQYFIDGYHGGIKAGLRDGTCRDIIQALKNDPEWNVTLDIEPITWDYVKREDPTAFEALKQYLLDKGSKPRVEITAGSYAQPYGWVIGGESNIRHLTRGREIVEKDFSGIRMDTYAVQEPCWTSAMPQILKSLGFKCAVLKDSTAWAGVTTGVDAEVLNWVGPDGTSIPAVPRYACEDLGSTCYIESFGGELDYVEKCIAHGIKHPVGTCIQDFGWKAVPWLKHGTTVYDISSGNLERKQVDLKDRKDRIEYVTWREYMETVASKPVQNWKFTQEDILCALPWGEKTLQTLARQVRSTENKALIAEKLSALSSILAGTTYPKVKLQDAWDQLLLAEHHDAWICATYNVGRNNWAWKVAAETWTADDLFDKVIAASRESLANVGGGTGNNSTMWLRVYNTLGVPRNDLVSLVMPSYPGAHGFRVYNSTGKEVVAQTTPTWGYNDGTINCANLLIRADVPSMGFSTYRIEPVKEAPPNLGAHAKTEDDGSVMIDSDLYKIKIDSSKGGVIASLYAKDLKKEFCSSSDERKFNEYRGYFITEKQWLSSIDSPAKVTILENGPIRVRLQIDGKVGRHPYRTLMTVIQGQRRVDLNVAFDFGDETWVGDPFDLEPNQMVNSRHKSFYNDKWKLQAFFPTDLSNQTIYKNSAYDVCQSRYEDTFYDSWDKIKNNIILNWVDTYSAEDNMGLAIFSDHTTSYNHGKDHPLSLTMAWGWQAGFWWGKCPLKGRQEIGYAILPHSGKWDQAGLSNECGQWCEPFQTQLLASKPKTGTESRSLIQVSGKGVEVPTMLVDGRDLLARLFNAEGANSVYIVTLASKASEVDQVELDGKFIKKLAVEKSSAGQCSTKLSIPRFGLRTLRFKNVLSNLF